MSIKLNCSQCGKSFTLKDTHAGRKAKCLCGNIISVPVTPDPPDIKLSTATLDFINDNKTDTLNIFSNNAQTIFLVALISFGLSWTFAFAFGAIMTRPDETVVSQKISDAKKTLEKVQEEIIELQNEVDSLPSPKDYFISIDIEKLDRLEIKINVTSNFPDGTILHIGVDRTYFEIGGTEKYSGEIYDELIPVLDGKIEKVVAVDDLGWQNKYLRDAQEKGFLIDYPGVGMVSDEIEISALYTPARPQPQKVSAILGKRGEYVKGEKVEFISAVGNTLRTEAHIDIPFIRKQKSK